LEVALDGGVWATAGSPTSVEAQRAYVVGFMRITFTIEAERRVYPDRRPSES
jgi:hypothetical protein